MEDILFLKEYSITKLTPLIKFGQKRVDCLLFSKNGAECQFLKLRCAESSFSKIKRYQCNLSFFQISLEVNFV